MKSTVHGFIGSQPILMHLIRKEDPSKVLSEKLRRIFSERGVDFFDKFQGDLVSEGAPTDAQASQDADAAATGDIAEDVHQHAMTPEELYKMRMEILPQL